MLVLIFTNFSQDVPHGKKICLWFPSMLDYILMETLVRIFKIITIR